MPKKRNFIEIRELILKSLSTGRKTVNELSKDSGINWKTVDNHLVYLLGKGMVTEVFSSPYVKIYEINDKGREYLGAKKK